MPRSPSTAGCRGASLAHSGLSSGRRLGFADADLRNARGPEKDSNSTLVNQLISSLRCAHSQLNILSAPLLTWSP